MQVDKLSRRQVMAGGVAVGLVAAPFVRSANAAGTLTIGLWDHWVPGANEVQSAIIKEWADKEKVDVKVDFITSQGNKLLLTLSAEATARSGHDIMEFTNWESAQMNAALEPVDDVVKSVVAQNGPIDPAVEYLGKFEGKWLGVPMTRGTLLLGCCSRFDLMKEYAGIDVQALYPAGKPPADAGWTWDAFLAAAEKCQRRTMPSACRWAPPRPTSGSAPCSWPMARSSWTPRATSRSSGRRPPGAGIRQEDRRVLSVGCPVVGQPSNNKWLLSGKASLIFNPPSAWAVGKRDAPQVAEKCWTHGFPKEPANRINPILPRFYGIWSFSKNEPAEEPARVPGHASGCREAGRRQPGLRHPRLPEVQ